MKRRFGIVMLLSFFIMAILFISAALQGHSNTPGSNFLRDLILGKEDTIQANLSSDFQNIIETQCPDGAASKCIRNFIQVNWGQLNNIVFIIGSLSNKTELYHAYWDNLQYPVSIVLILSEEDGKKLVSGWRGFIISEGEYADTQLLNGERHDNEFTVPQ